jgi:ribosomal protein S19
MFSVYGKIYDKNKKMLTSEFISAKDKEIQNSFLKKKIYSRSCSIPSFFINTNLNLYKNKQVVSLNLNKNLIGYKLGEFAFTRKPFFFTPKEKKKKNIKR